MGLLNGIFDKKSALDKEWEKVLKQEKQYIEKNREKKQSIINQKLEGKVPDKLQGTLDMAFSKAFALVFEKGTGVIEKTYRKETIEQNYKIQQYAVEISQSRKSLRAISKNAGQSGIKNLAVSGVTGVSMGLLGIGLPDIPILTGMILKSIYEIALRYGYTYDSPKEQIYILLLIQGALSNGEEMIDINEIINHYIKTCNFNQEIWSSQSQESKLLQKEHLEKQIHKTAHLLSKELLYMKFIQGIPIVGAIGGVYDAIYMKHITAYAQLKYKQRYLYHQKTNK